MKNRSSIKNRIKNVRTWIEVDVGALRSNLLNFRKLIGPKVKMMAVVKSNAYGHGLVDFVRGLKEAEKDIRGSRGADWLGVDTLSEARTLRRAGIKRPILVLGYTLPGLFREAAAGNISLTVSTFESLRFLKKIRRQPKIHLKIDTGMHRQGFLPEQVPAAIGELRRAGLLNEVEGVFTHLAAPDKRAYTQRQLRIFEGAQLEFQARGFLPLLRHAAATGGTLLYPEARYDMARIGIGLYGFWPSAAVEKIYRSSVRRSIFFRPILSWKAVVSEVKTIPAGSFVGYDLTEKVSRPTQVAVIPVGYWHGIDRGLSSRGEVLVRGRRSRILGRVSMDMIVIDVTGMPVRPGDVAVLIGRQGKEEITAYEWAEKLGTSHYEVITRLNPLIQKIYLP